MASLGKSRVKNRASDQSWEEEEMMYEINRRNLKRQKRKLEASKVTPEQKEEKRLERKREKWMMEEPCSRDMHYESFILNWKVY